MKKLKILELFAGTRSIGRAFEANGHEVYSVEWDKKHKDIDLYIDINELTSDYILEHFGKPDIIWASPDCTTYSVAGCWYHRPKIDGINIAKTDYAKFCDKTNAHVIKLIKELEPKYYFIENPRGLLRSADFMSNLPRYTITYCQYGSRFMKPTDIWTNHPNPNFKPMCKPGSKCHESAPSGTHKGVQSSNLTKVEKSKIPPLLCEHIVKISEV